MFKEAEEGDKEIFIERTEEALATGADIIATACPYCMVMLTDGIKYKDQGENVKKCLTENNNNGTGGNAARDQGFHRQRVHTRCGSGCADLSGLFRYW